MFKNILKEKGLSITKQRLALLQVLQQINTPATIEMIKSHMDTSIDVTTLYRSLSALVETGIVYQTDFREGVAYFELQTQHHHHHLVCTSCKTKTALSYCPEMPISDIEQEHNFRINNHVFEIFGTCSLCLE